MKIRINYLFFLRIIFLSCANNETKKKIDDSSPTSTIEKKVRDNCLEFKNFYESLSSNTKNVDFAIATIKCKLNTKINTKKYQSAILKDHFKLSDKVCLFYKMNCLAGGDCAEYYLAVLDEELSLLDNKLLAKDYSQGEQNEYLKSYSIKEGTISLKIMNEDFNEKTEDYVEEESSINYVVTEKGEITKTDS